MLSYQRRYIELFNINIKVVFPVKIPDNLDDPGKQGSPAKPGQVGIPY